MTDSYCPIDSHLNLGFYYAGKGLYIYKFIKDITSYVIGRSKQLIMYDSNNSPKEWIGKTRR